MSEHPVKGPLSISLVLIAGEILFLPNMLITIGAGFAFKRAYHSVKYALLYGTLACWFGACIGAIISMLIGRFLLRD